MRESRESPLKLDPAPSSPLHARRAGSRSQRGLWRKVAYPSSVPARPLTGEYLIASPDLSAKFLRFLWRVQSQDGHAFISLKDKLSGEWNDYSIPVDQSAGPLALTLPSSSKGDIYFSPNLFSAPKRQNDLALASRLLFADLDEVDPSTLPIRPSIAWESSPARYQAIWILTRRLTPQAFPPLNRLLTYTIGADKGGWHQSKVLRLPFTRNYKYRGRPYVKLLWFSNKRYDPARLSGSLAAQPSPNPASASSVPAEALRAAAKPLPPLPPDLPKRTRALLKVKKPMPAEDRSALLYDIEHSLLKHGLSTVQTFAIVKNCAYNKYKGQRREDRQLWSEILKAQRNIEGASSASKPAAQRRKRPTKQASKLLQTTNVTRFLGSMGASPSWLVEGVWGRAAHGIWAGEFKSYKSTLLLELAVCVATGKAFGQRYDVKRPGTVLFINEENSREFMQDKLHRIIQSYGLGNEVIDNGNKAQPLVKFGPSIPLEIKSLAGFSLTDPQHIDALESLCVIHKPVLIVLDPLYRLAPELDEKDSAAMGPLLDQLAKISNKYDTALILAHHYNQPTQENRNLRSGYRISGTSVFARWFESSIYAERKGEEGEYKIKLHSEHREHAPLPSQTVTVELDPDDSNIYALHFDEDSEGGADDGAKPDGGTSLPIFERPKVSVVTVKKELGLSHSKQARRMLEANGYTIKRVKDKQGNIRLIGVRNE